MGDEYQLRRDIDKIYQKTYDYDDDIWNIYTKDEIHENFYDKDQVDELIDSGGTDLSDYVRKDEFLDLFDVDFNYNWGNPLLNDDSITIELFLKEKENGDGV